MFSNSSPRSVPHPWQASFYSLLLWVWLFWIIYLSVIRQYWSFCDWFISLSRLSSRFSLIVVNGKISFFLWLNNISLCHVFFIHSSFNGCLGCFHIWATLNNATVNMGVLISLWDPDFKSDYYWKKKDQCFQECAEIGIIVHCGWNYKIMSLLQKTVWRFLKKYK